MKKLVMLTLLCVVTFSTVSASAGCIEDKITFGDKADHSLSIYASKPFGQSSFGWSAIFVAGQSWSEGYVGPTWSPAPWLQLDAFIGLQSAGSGENPIRYAGSVWLGNSIGSIYAIAEKGAKSDDYWWKVKPLIGLGHGIKVGAIIEKDVDVAPLLEMDIAQTGIALWGAYRKDGSLLGLKYNF